MLGVQTFGWIQDDSERESESGKRGPISSCIFHPIERLDFKAGRSSYI